MTAVRFWVPAWSSTVPGSELDRVKPESVGVAALNTQWGPTELSRLAAVPAPQCDPRIFTARLQLSLMFTILSPLLDPMFLEGRD